MPKRTPRLRSRISRTRHAVAGGAATKSQKAAGRAKNDELDDALEALNRSTNRLRRKFDATDTWMETKLQVQQVLDDGRRINQAVARGSYSPRRHAFGRPCARVSTILLGATVCNLWPCDPNRDHPRALWRPRCPMVGGAL